MTDPWTTPEASPEGKETLPPLEPLIVTFRVEDADIAGHSMRALVKKPLVIVLVLASAAAIIHAAVTGKAGAFLGLPAFVVIFLVLLWRGQKARIQSLREEQRSVTMELTEPHFVIADRESRLMLAWKSFTHFVEVPTAFHVFESNGQFRVLPKKALSGDEADLARRWFARNLPPKNPAVRASSYKTLALWLFLVVLFFAIYRVVSKS